MYLFLFNLAGLALVGWVLLIVLPAWRVSRWVASRSVFPIFLALLCVAGMVPLMAQMGPGIIRDFGTAEGVRALLGNPDVALIASIHLLAFDQAVGVMIYRDNMEHRWVPLPVQSVILFATLMFGPLGFLLYLALRALTRSRRAAAEDAEDRVAAHPAAV